MDLESFKASRGLNLTELSKLLDRPVSTVHGWLNGTRRPDWSSLQDIARATNGAVTADDFVGGPARPTLKPGLAEAQSPLLPEAQALGIDVAKVTEAALKQAIGDEKARRWAEENRDAIEAHRRYIEEHDTPLAKYRMF